MWFCPETWPVQQLLAAQGSYFWGKIQSLLPVSDCFSLLLSVSSPRRKQVTFEEKVLQHVLLMLAGAVVGAFLYWAYFTRNLPNEGGVSALESPFH